MATQPGDAQQTTAREKENGLSTQGLHRHAWLCPGSCTPFLTFLDHRLVQETHSRVIYRLQIEEDGNEGPDGLSRLLAPLPLDYVCSALRAPPAA